jgi:hypothetical protein
LKATLLTKEIDMASMTFAETENDDYIEAVRRAATLNAAGMDAYIVNYKGAINCLRRCAVGYATIIDIHKAVA